MSPAPFYLRLDPDSGVPLGVQIANALRLAIVTGRLQQGEQLPSARDLAADLAVNFHTVRKAYGGLEHEGLLEFRRGLGTFVAATRRTTAADVRKVVRTHVEALARDLAGVDVDVASLAELLRSELERLAGRRKP